MIEMPMPTMTSVIWKFRASFDWSSTNWPRPLNTNQMMRGATKEIRSPPMCASVAHSRWSASLSGGWVA